VIQSVAIQQTGEVITTSTTSTHSTYETRGAVSSPALLKMLHATSYFIKFLLIQFPTWEDTSHVRNGRPFLFNVQGHQNLGCFHTMVTWVCPYDAEIFRRPHQSSDVSKFTKHQKWRIQATKITQRRLVNSLQTMSSLDVDSSNALQLTIGVTMIEYVYVYTLDTYVYLCTYIIYKYVYTCVCSVYHICLHTRISSSIWVNCNVLSTSLDRDILGIPFFTTA